MILDDGLRRRLEQAGGAIAWRPAGGRGAAADRIAHLHDEEARVRRSGAGGRVRLMVDPGPVGALVILLEIGPRGPPARLEALDVGKPPFPGGALVAQWGTAKPTPGAREIPLDDLVGVARYALV